MNKNLLLATALRLAEDEKRYDAAVAYAAIAQAEAAGRQAKALERIADVKEAYHEMDAQRWADEVLDDDDPLGGPF